MNIQQPLNEKVVQYLFSKLEVRKDIQIPIFATKNYVYEPYMNCGSHPDTVIEIWDNIGKKLPCDCHGVIHNKPGLVHAETGVIFALTMGTTYQLRLPGEPGKEAVAAGYTSLHQWSKGESDRRDSLGEDWYFGRYLPKEVEWCRQVYQMFESKDNSQLNFTI